ncbi:MAG: hypothetical protein ACJ74Y_01220 [Bryobacteraceae bacterium]
MSRPTNQAVLVVGPPLATHLEDRLGRDELGPAPAQVRQTSGDTGALRPAALEAPHLAFCNVRNTGGRIAVSAR